MEAIDLSSLTEPISSDSPSGPDLEYDADFVALEDAMRTEPEQQFGDTLIAATEPDWDRVCQLAVSLLSRSKDLRAALYLTHAQAHGNGLAGLAQGLKLILALLQEFWDSLHPQLDPDDDLDPTARVNIVASLCDESLLPIVRNAPIVQVPILGSISLRDLEIAKGELPPPADADEVLKLDSIEAAVGDVGSPVLQETLALVQSAVADGVAIEQVVTDKVGVTQAVRLNALLGMLREIETFLKERVLTQAEQITGDDDLTGAPQGESDQPAVVTQAKPLSGTIDCARDVTTALDKIIDYYVTHEPSSPVPLLLERAKRLVSAGFMEILRDIAPDAVAQAENVTGVGSESVD